MVQCVDLAYDNFLSVTNDFINSYIPDKTVTISDNTPSYFPPLIKSLLRRRNKLTRRVKLNSSLKSVTRTYKT